eukprot:CAMPEP_0201922348 /NCGR_PEP_ID=MMETSP0903-20130614/10404_1 /ASSEMBLY_ACC=CAM_ASM_000552 /TAXON_ID=420261 /ORGANISM="Thalassiosira antarctica, Strain CCMP982" /LENGTH=70 /DNA_ID=CAMNT_0048459459 /DNA_START=16 /DNA_END=224 /DNA_ORIENTATION=-
MAPTAAAPMDTGTTQPGVPFCSCSGGLSPGGYSGCVIPGMVMTDGLDVGGPAYLMPLSEGNVMPGSSSAR